MIKIKNELNENTQRCKIGLLAMTGIENLRQSSALDKIKCLLEEEIREKYAGMTRNELKQIPAMASYVTYYKKFGYTYHVLQQVESVASGKKSISVSGLVDSMFMAEMKNMILTAGHDLEKLIDPISIKTATGEESYVCMNGRETNTVPDDIIITDGKAVISSILRGPDRRSCISDATTRVLYTAYAPAGISEEDILLHLDDIESYVRVFAPKAETVFKQIRSAE